MQWATNLLLTNSLDPAISSTSFTILAAPIRTVTQRLDGKIEVEVEQLVKDLDGHILFNDKVTHIYIIDDGLLKQLDINETTPVLICVSTRLLQPPSLHNSKVNSQDTLFNSSYGLKAGHAALWKPATLLDSLILRR